MNKRPPPPQPYTLNLSRVADPVGVILEIGERRYAVVAAGPRELTWSGACQTCGQKFSVASPRDKIESLASRCAQHRRGRPPAAA